jgi:predicted esterase
VIERSIATRTHGRYLVVPPAALGPAPLLVGFHGYAEGAEAQLERLRAIPGADRWRLASIQGLHRFYQRRTNEVVAGWMTRQDRELAIADNLAYVAGVIEALGREWPGASRVVLAGFSQGVAMTFRAAAAGRVDGVIAVGGDVPPELDAAALAHVPAVLVCRGARDEFYAAATFDSDVRRLREAGAEVRPVLFEGAHEWSDEVVRAASVFLHERFAGEP